MVGDARPLSQTSLQKRFAEAPKTRGEFCLQVSVEAQLDRLRFICAKEAVEAEPAALEGLLRLSNGDLRQAVNLLQVPPAVMTRGVEDGVEAK